MKKYVYFSLFLCLTLAQCGHEKKKRKNMANINSNETDVNTNSECSQKSASKKKKLFDGDNPYQMTVVMGNDTDDHTPKQNIVIYHGCRDKESVDPDYASYTAINCKLALWVVRKINDFINLNTPIVNATFDAELVQFAKDVRYHVDRFIIILMNFLEKIANSSFYMDKSVLKAFLSLKIKTSLLISRNDFVETGINKTQEEIIELLLVEIVELQRYTSVHCDYTTVRTSRIADIFKVWVFVDGPTEDDKSMEAFLRIIAKTGLEPNGPLNNCHARQILLEGIVEICGSDAISPMVLNVMLDEGGQELIMIRQIAHRMLVSYDVDVFSWYHDSILATTMKLLCHAVLTSKNVLSDAAENAINEINKKILAKKDVLPAYFSKGFDLFRENVDNGDVISYFDRLSYIHVEPSTYGMTGLADQLLERILQHFDQITCAEEYLKHLRGEYDKYYDPGSHNRNTLLADYSGSDESAYATNGFKPTACAFVVGLYIHAVHYSDIDARGVKTNLTRTMITISDLCIMAIRNERDNWHLIRTAYDVAVMLRNQWLDPRDKKQMLFLYERVINWVMSELNVYRTKYCRKATHEYLAIESGLILYKNYKSLRGYMQHFFVVRYGFILPEPESSTPVDGYDRYFRVDYLYENYVKNSDVVKRRSNVVRVYWNQRLLSVDDVFAELTNTTLDPRNVYALYDVFNKFFLAVIFYDARCALVGSDYMSLRSELAILSTAFDFNDYLDVFPDGLAALKTDLLTIFSFPYTRIDPDGTVASEMSEMDAVNKLRKAMSEAEVKFVQSNLVIDNDADKRLSKSNDTTLESFTFLLMLDKEVNLSLRKFNEEFQKLRRFY